MSNGAIVAKSKAVYGTFLKKEDYDNLMHRTSVGAIVSYLKATQRYRALLEGADPALTHRAQIESLLGRGIFETYMKIRRFAASKRGGTAGFYIRSAEAEQLAHAVIAVSSGSQQNFFISLPEYIMDWLSFDIAAAARAASFPELLHALEGTIYFKPLQPYLESPETDVNKCLTAINACYLKWVFTHIDREFSGRKKTDLKRFFLRKADSDNVLLCYRLKKFFDADDEQIKSLLVPYHSRVKPEDIDEALKNQDATAALIELLFERCMKNGNDINGDYPEIDIARANYRFFRQRLALTTDETEAVCALIVLMETERANLQKIIEGIRYGMPPQEIESFIIV